MTFDIKDVLKQCYLAAREYRENPSDDYIIEKIVGFIDSNNPMMAKYVPVEKPKYTEEKIGDLTILHKKEKPADADKTGNSFIKAEPLMSAYEKKVRDSYKNLEREDDME